MRIRNFLLSSLLAIGTLGQLHMRQTSGGNMSTSVSETSYTTFTSTRTENGTSVVHTHSQPLNYSTSASPSTSSYSSSGQAEPTGLPGNTTSYSSTSFVYSPSVTVGPASTSVSNATCSGATLNVLGASLDWWYTETYIYAVSTFSVQLDSNNSPTGWTLLPATSTFDVAAAVAAPTCTVTPIFNTDVNRTLEQYSCYSTPGPVAAATTVVPQVAFTTPNATTGTGQIPNVAVTPAPPAITIPNSGGSFSTGTPFVFFSAYEIMSNYPTTYSNGSRGCAQTTQVYNMSHPFSFEYTGTPVNGSLEVGAGVTGDVNPAFLGIVNVTAVAAGSWVAAPTVAFVVEEVVAAEILYRPAENTEISAPSLATPTVTIPSYLQPAPPQTTQLGVQSAIPATVHIESTGNFLELPTQSTVNTGNGEQSASTALADQTPTTTGAGSGGGNLIVQPFAGQGASSEVTIEVAVTPGQSVVTAAYSGQIVTATALSALRQGQPAPAPDLNNLVSAVVSAAQPTNALQVLSEAESPAGSNPTAAAIISGLGGAASVGGGGGAPVPNSGSNSGAPGGSSPGSSPNQNGGSPAAPGAAANIPLLTVGTNTYTANAATQFSLGPGATLTPGGTVLVGGTTVGLESGATAVVVNGETSSLSAPVITPAPLVTLGSTVYAANAGSTYDIGGSLLSPGQAITVSGSTISLAPGATAIVVNGATTTLNGAGSPSQNGNFATITAPPVITINGQPIAGSGDTSYIVSGQTLKPGSAITITGPNGVETISLNSAANDLVYVVGGMTMTSMIGAGAMPTAAPVLTIDGETFSAIGNGPTYLIDGQTLTPGEIEKVTISGHVLVISLAPQATLLVIEEEGPNGQITATSMETLFPGSVSATQYIDAVGSASAGASVSASSASATGNSGGPHGLSSAAPSLTLQLSALCVALASFILAVWL